MCWFVSCSWCGEFTACYSVEAKEEGCAAVVAWECHVAELTLETQL